MKLYQTFKSSGSSSGNIFFCGDQLTISLTLPAGQTSGSAFVRTNIGFCEIHRAEIIAETENGTPRSNRDWHDLAMQKKDVCTWELTLPLVETGFFEAKAGWRSNDGHQFWPESGNMFFKVEPSATVGANQIYTAFVRQFRPLPGAPGKAEAEKLLDSMGYTVIPPSGTFRDLIKKLDHIFGTLGMRILQLLPIHPVPESYARMGRYGSPFAALDYFAVDPALAEFDKRTTAMEQFCELIDQVHARRGHIFMDIPVNHTGWGSRTQEEHPEFFKRENNGDFASPGAWGIVWEDLCSLDYNLPEVHKLMAEVFLFWCRKGVDGFRCDAGYMLPSAAWDYITSRVRQEYPNTIFLLEGLGGPLDKQKELLFRNGLNWGYSELFQNYSLDQIGWQYGIIKSACREYGNLVNFSETHDNSRLAAKSTVWSRMRMGLCALLSENGAFGFANGAEFFAVEQIDVHGNKDLNWGAADNQVELIERLNSVLARHPAFYAGSTSVWIGRSASPVIMIRRTSSSGNALLILVNTDINNPVQAEWQEKDFHVQLNLCDLLQGAGGAVFAGGYTCRLAPGGCTVIGDPGCMTDIHGGEPVLITKQKAAELAQKIWLHWNDPTETPVPSTANLLDDLAQGFDFFAGKYSGCRPAPVTRWNVPEDSRRTVIVPSGDLLCIESEYPFVFSIADDSGKTAASGKSAMTAAAANNIWACLLPKNKSGREKYFTVTGTVFLPDSIKKFSGKLLQTPPGGDADIDFTVPGGGSLSDRIAFLASNNLGGMAQIRARWGEIFSKYDCWLGANCSHEMPRDRRIMLSRIRGWIVCGGYSTELSANVIKSFTAAGGNIAVWDFDVPAGSGRKAGITVTVRFSTGSDAVKAEFKRSANDTMDGDTPLKIILRPDVDDRINHQVTKAFTGPETTWPSRISCQQNGFIFAPGSASLHMTINKGSYIHQPEWKYMVSLADEALYGLDSSTDIFSPGYFEFVLSGQDTVELCARVLCGNEVSQDISFPDGLPQQHSSQLQAAYNAMTRYMVKRNGRTTVIAGYPWFLDWGRDTFIALRGLIAAGYTAEARAIILEFASFEDRGTIPNMIHGSDVSNRDTSDAPLWLITAVRELTEAAGNDNILSEVTASGRSVAEVLNSIVYHYLHGTPNGIYTDLNSMLVFSPPHFTWMDTAHPAATPRCGYPVEIQALWFAANRFLGSKGNKECAGRAEQIALSIKKYYYLKNKKQFSDCLHAPSGTPAAQAEADDALRPNALFAVTLGAVTDPELVQCIISSTSSLLIPGAIRSLADRQTTPPLAIYRNGKLLNNPSFPYCGTYAGNEDEYRKPAYHNGTAWYWPYPSWIEAAWLFSDRSVSTAERLMGILYSSRSSWTAGCPGELPEVADGDHPHRWGGCGAQAWSVTEFYRAAKMLQENLLK